MAKIVYVSRVCAVVVTRNRSEALGRCLDALSRETRPPDRILVVDNASTDGTRELLESGFASLARLHLQENAGSAGAINAGMRWAHCNKYDWIWVLDDSVEVLPECLETMLSFEQTGDLIQIRAAAPGEKVVNEGEISWKRVRHCDFQAALISRKIIEAAGMPDHRYFRSDDDVAYGYIASLHGNSICLDYTGARRDAQPANRNSVAFYLDLRNRFLTREFLTRNGAPPAPAEFMSQAVLALFRAVRAALESTDKLRNVRAALDGFRDGLHGRFDRLPAV